MIVLILLFIALCGVSNGCPTDSFGYGSSCYNLIRVNATWAEAMVYCKEAGTQLAMVETAEEQNFLKALLTNESNTIDSRHRGVWIAGLDYLVEGGWQWGYHRRAISTFFWAAHQPDDKINGRNGQNCVMMSGLFHFKWDDNYCSAEEFFLCESEESMNP